MQQPPSGLCPHWAVSLRRLLHASSTGPRRDLTFSLTSSVDIAGNNSSPSSGNSSESSRPPAAVNGTQPRQRRRSGSSLAGPCSLVKRSPSRIPPPQREHVSSSSARNRVACPPELSAASPALSLCGLPSFPSLSLLFITRASSNLLDNHSSSYPRKLTAFWSRFSLPWSYLITVFGSLCLLIICTCR